MVLNSPLCKVTLQLEVIQTLFSLNGGLVLQKEKESIDVDDLFKGKALRLWNENHDCILLRRTHYFLQHKAKICGCSIKSALTKEIESIKKSVSKFKYTHFWLLNVVMHTPKWKFCNFLPTPMLVERWVKFLCPQNIAEDLKKHTATIPNHRLWYHQMFCNLQS